MGKDRDSARLESLAEIQRLALDGDDMAQILGGAAAPLTAGFTAARVTIRPGSRNAVSSVAASFDIAADGVIYGVLEVERADPLTGEDRLFVSVAAGLLASAFVRLNAPPSPPRIDLENGDVPPAVGLIHRMRNILSVIRIIVRRTAGQAISVEDYAAQLDGRIGALARVQTALIMSQGYSTDLGTLINDEMVAHSIRENRVRAHGPRIPLKAKAAETLGLTVHELVVNAIKFGALSVKDGRVDVTWWIEEESKPGRLRLDWIESGVPVMGAAPRVKGFGHELIERTLPYELSATTSVDFQPGGFRCALAIPLSDRVIHSDALMVQ